MKTPIPLNENRPDVGDLVEWDDPVHGGSGVYGIVIEAAMSEFAVSPRRYIHIRWLNSDSSPEVYGKFALDYNVKVLSKYHNGE
tara:strand:- start:5 stop:256 length:252 start_codon:yes stop_codon:yes gene_type:complete